jgi:integrase/recombinase XerD
MARIFHHSYTAFNSRTGKREQRLTRKWYIEYRDERGCMHRVPGFRDKIATQRKAVELEHAVIRIERGQKPLPRINEDRPLAERLEEYVAHLTAKGDAEVHVKKTRRLIEILLAGVRAEYGEDLHRGRVENWLTARRSTVNATTNNHYARAVKGFTRWLLAEDYLPSDPFTGLRLVNPDTDRRRVRRALSADEFARLLAATERAGKYEGLTGPDRAMLYKVAGYTGLRRAELFSLTAASFALDAAPPTVTVDAKDSKRRRRDILPVPEWLAAELRPWLTRRASGRLWPAAERLRTAAMLAEDLGLAGLLAIDAEGRVFDFHALRGQFVTSLARAGVPLAAAQKLARHSTPTLTAKAYTHLDLKDLAAEAAKVQPPPTPALRIVG